MLLFLFARHLKVGCLVLLSPSMVMVCSGGGGGGGSCSSSSSSGIGIRMSDSLMADASGGLIVTVVMRWSRVVDVVGHWTMWMWMASLLGAVDAGLSRCGSVKATRVADRLQRASSYRRVEQSCVTGFAIQASLSGIRMRRKASWLWATTLVRWMRSERHEQPRDDEEFIGRHVVSRARARWIP